jgi:hypothetical protein
MTDEDFIGEPAEVPPEPRRKRRKYRRCDKPVCSPEEKAALLEFQGHTCGVCGRDNVELHLDHSYRSGRTRGYLCRTHNTTLGMFMDSTKMLQAALRYFRNPPGDQLRKETNNK